MSNLLSHFASIKDYRYKNFVIYPLSELLFSSFIAILCGFEDYEEIVAFSLHELEWLRKYLTFKNGIASVSTYEAVFRHLDSQQFNAVFMAFMADFAPQSGVISLDGKALRGSKTSDKQGMKNGAIYLLNAFAHETGLLLGQVQVGEKSNEITALPQLLAALELKGMVVTLDAMGTQKAVAAQIIDQKGDYALALKGNQGNLLEDVRLFEQDDAMNARFTTHETLDCGHGRIEKRTCRATQDIDWLKTRHDFKGLRSIYAIHSHVTFKKTGKICEETRYFISSLPANAENLLKITRKHWGIESFHWSLDVTFGEDKSRVRKDNAPANLSLLRKHAYNCLKNIELPKKKSIKIKQLDALLDKTFREKLTFQ